MNKILLIFTVFHINSLLAQEVPFPDKCPNLPEHIKLHEPIRTDFISVPISHPDYENQDDKYQKALERFQQKYAKDIALVDLEWEKLEASSFESQNKFYEMLAVDKHEKLFFEIKSACWEKEMGIDEWEKDNACHSLERKPTKTNWNNILLCTSDRVKSLQIELF